MGLGVMEGTPLHNLSGGRRKGRIDFVRGRPPQILASATHI